jgi:hypothetical protein
VIVAGVLFSIYALLPRERSVRLPTDVPRWYTANERIRRPTYVNSDHGLCGSCPTDKHVSSAWQLTDLIAHIEPQRRFLVNIGAASTGGGRYDPTFPLLASLNSSFGALLIDPNSNPLLLNAYPKRNNIHIKNIYIWPESVVNDVFVDNRIEKQFAILKIDIDSYECSLVDAILRAGYLPDVIHMEFNPIFAPPVVFMPIYNATVKHDWKPALWLNLGPFYGCSLSALSKVLLPFDYVLLQVEFWDVIYVRHDIARARSLQVPASDEIAYANGFLDHSCLPYCRTNPKLYNERIKTGIETHSNRSNFTEALMLLLDLYTPTSSKTHVKHPYIIQL